MGLLDSLGQILPYAIPAAAGMALGGPALGMIGAGGAAAAQSQNLGEQMKLAEMMNEAGYRNADLGLRKQEIQSNEALRKQALKQTGAEHQATLDETKLRDQEHAQEAAMVNQLRLSTMQLQQQNANFSHQLAMITEGDRRDKMQKDWQDSIRSQLGRVDGLLQSAAEKDWSKQGFAKRDLPEWAGGLNTQAARDKFINDNKEKFYLNNGISPHTMKQAGFNDAEISSAFPSWDPKTGEMEPPKGAAPSAASAKLKAAGKGSATPTTLKTSMPDTPPGHAYHINGKAYTVKGGVATEVPNA